MTARPCSTNPWPLQTPLSAPIPSRRRSPKRRRLRDYASAGTSKSAKRQLVPDQSQIDDALTQCQLLSGNNIISCYPHSDTILAQHEWTSFVWNSRRPQLTQTNLVDIYLFRGDSRQQILYFPRIQNPSDQAGRLTAQVNDSWWGNDGTNWNGKNRSYPFFWVVTNSGSTLDSNAIAQSTFTAVQTTYADSIVASMSSASAASVASASLLSASRSANAVPTSSLQSTGSGSEFPRWAIAVIVVLGFLAIAASCLLAFLILRRMRRHRGHPSNRNSITSSSPMITNTGGPSSPLLAGAVGAGLGIARPSSIMEEKSRAGHRDDPSVVGHDAASSISHGGSGTGGTEHPPFSGHDAAIMADAFRKMLRQPDFAVQPVEEVENREIREETDTMINRELAEEGRDIRSVRSERGVRVEQLSDSGTVHDQSRD